MNNLLSKLISQPLAMHESGAKMLQSLQGQTPQQGFDRNLLKMDYLGNDIPKPYDLEDGTRVIPLHGPITRGLGILGQYCGMADLDAFQRDVNEAASDPSVMQIILHIQSPGGTAVGCCEASEVVKNASMVKPVKTYTDEMMASAAYFIGSAAEEVYTTKSSLVGSIGTYVVLVDDSKLMERIGISYTVLRSGKYKGAGIDGYSDEQIEEMQSMVDGYGEQFRQYVSEYRQGAVDPDDMQGQIFMGEKSVEKNLADFVVDNLLQIV